jgi:hypothetical protein
MAQVLGNLGTSVTKDTSRSEEHQAPTSSSNPALDLPDIEMPFPEDTEQPEPHTEVNNPVEQTEHIEKQRNNHWLIKVRKTLTFPINRKQQAKATIKSES